MSDSVLVEIRRPEAGRVRECSSCGVLGSAGCDCGAALTVPALERAKTALLANPEKSNRAIAEIAQVDKDTVLKARKNNDLQTTGENSPVDRKPLIGKDGKSRKPRRDPPDLEKGEERPSKIQEKLEIHGWYQRAELAAQEARYAPVNTCPKNSKMRRLAKDVIEAWTLVLNQIEEGK